MLFNSFTFVVFLAVVLPLYYALSCRGQNRMLMLASCVFYGAWSLWFLGLLLISIFVDYALGHAIHTAHNPTRRKWLVAASCVLNLGVLAFFKYANFLVGSTTGLLQLLHLPVPSIYVNVLLPIGISFYTFHSMSYIIDIYRRVLIPLHRFSDYALYVLYFPQLVAGPIARANFLIPQIHNPRQVTYDGIVQGSWLMLWGFFKKLVIADNAALVADSVFSAPATSGLTCLVGIYAFALQIYGDFSGYTDIARGIAKLMGIELSFNFNLPYLAKNPAELWRRWHISLSTWLRDYLYIPLGGNRHGEIKTYRNLLLTMLLGGLWHGAAWHFVAWGGYHGTLLAGHRLVTGNDKRAPSNSGLIKAVKVFVMFHLTCLGWLLFRAVSLRQVGEFCGAIFSRFHVERTAIPLIAAVIFWGALLWAVEAWLRNAEDPRSRPFWKRGLGPVAVACVIGGIIILTPGNTREFIYFRF
jgi:alginate O-acetyltransferase complex protein AlgI